MRFGVFDHMDRAQPDLAQQYADRLQLIEAYDRGGLYGYHMAEHHGTPLGLAPSPGLFLAAAAQHSQRLRLGTLVYTLPQYNPLRLIEEICMLDELSSGRFDFGIGRGVSPIELAFYGLSEAEAGERFLECREIIRAGLTSERLTFHGAHYDFDAVPITGGVNMGGGAVPSGCSFTEVLLQNFEREIHRASGVRKSPDRDVIHAG